MDPHLIAPGSMTTLAAAVIAEMVNLVESVILILPLLSGVVVQSGFGVLHAASKRFQGTSDTKRAMLT